MPQLGGRCQVNNNTNDQGPDEIAFSGLAKDLSDLFDDVRKGHFGPVLYTNDGSALFTKVVETECSNPYVGEVGLIKANAKDIAEWAKDIENVIIVGSGPPISVLLKEKSIIDEMINLKRIKILERSPEFARDGKTALEKEFHGVDITAYETDFLQHDADESTQPALVIATGGLTDFEDVGTESFPRKQLEASLLAFKKLAGPGGKIIWGYDSKLDDSGYRSKEVSDFLLYPLNKAAQRPEITINPANFRYEPTMHAQASHLAHQWVLANDETVILNGKKKSLFAGEAWTIFSCVKPDPAKVRGTGDDNGLPTARLYVEPGGAVIHCFDCK